MDKVIVTLNERDALEIIEEKNISMDKLIKARKQGYEIQPFTEGDTVRNAEGEIYTVLAIEYPFIRVSNDEGYMYKSFEKLTKIG